MSLISTPYLPLSIVWKWSVFLNFVLYINFYYAMLLLLNVMLLYCSHLYFMFQFLNGNGQCFGLTVLSTTAC